MTEERSTRALSADEERLWGELHHLVDSLPVDKVDQPGYFQEGWSAKDLIAHIGSWLAEAGVVLERIRFGTYQPEEIDVDAMNQAFYARCTMFRSQSCGHKGSQLGTGCSEHGDHCRRIRRRGTDGSAKPARITTRSTCRGSGSGSASWRGSTPSPSEAARR